MFNILAAAALVAASIAPATVSDPAAPVPAPKAKQEQTAKKERKYCASTELTGSRVAKQVCKTRQQWIDSEGFDPASSQSR